MARWTWSLDTVRPSCCVNAVAAFLVEPCVIRAAMSTSSLRWPLISALSCLRMTCFFTWGSTGRRLLDSAIASVSAMISMNAAPSTTNWSASSSPTRSRGTTAGTRPGQIRSSGTRRGTTTIARPPTPTCAMTEAASASPSRTANTTSRVVPSHGIRPIRQSRLGTTAFGVPLRPSPAATHAASPSGLTSQPWHISAVTSRRSCSGQ